MHALVRRVATALRVDRLAGPGDRVVVALSGGPDSVALGLLLAETLPLAGATLAGAAHLHHGLRGAEADDDESFCRTLSMQLRVPFFVEHEDVAALAKADSVSIETAGHRARRAFYEHAARQLDATRVATGHTKNDQAETFLMRALRGAGLRGLGGIRPSRGLLIRPLLSVSRSELLSYLAERKQAYREDSTNRDRRILRNRIRHETLPWLQQQEGERVLDALARAARVAAADEACLEQAARRVTKSAPWIVLLEGAGLAIDAAALRHLPRALQNRVMLEGLERVSGRTGSMTSVDCALGVLAAGGRARALLGGVEVRVADDKLTLTSRVQTRERGTNAAQPWFPALPGTALPVPGQAVLVTGSRIDASRGPRVEGPGTGDLAARPPHEAMLDAERCRLPLSVRFRRPGDRLQPLGMAGRKKLQDLMVDRKIPREQRDRIPLVVDANDQILWVAGHAVAEAGRVTPATTSVLLLQYWQ